MWRAQTEALTVNESAPQMRWHLRSSGVRVQRRDGLGGRRVECEADGLPTLADHPCAAAACGR